MKVNTKCLLVIMLAALFCLGAADAVRACCIYNHTDGPIDIYLGCGTGCHNHWWLDPGQRKCRHGAGGKVEWGIYTKDNTSFYNADGGTIKVDNHGYVSFYQRKGHYLVKSWDKHDNLKKTIKLNMYH